MMVQLLKKKAHLVMTVQPCESAQAFSIKLQDNYEILSTVHDGQSSIVKRATHIKTGSTYAVKSILKAKVVADALVSEFESMMQLDHPNVLCLHEVFEDFQYIHLVLPYCGGGEILEQVLEA